MAQEVLLRYGYYNVFVALHYALAAQTRVNTRVYGTVNVVFFFVRNLRQVVHSGFYVHVAGTATAHTATVVL